MDSSSPNLVEYGTTSLYCKMENFVGWKFELPILCIMCLFFLHSSIYFCRVTTLLVIRPSEPQITGINVFIFVMFYAGPTLIFGHHCPLCVHLLNQRLRNHLLAFLKSILFFSSWLTTIG